MIGRHKNKFRFGAIVLRCFSLKEMPVSGRS